MKRIRKTEWPARVLLTICIASVCCVAQSTDPTETIRIDTHLVDLQVRITNPVSKASRSLLTQSDFQIFEDGEAQEIAFFAAADTPSDLILLLDLSGSTANKIKLIRRSAKAFVEATRPVDRVGIVTFTDTLQVISPLTSDRKTLLKLIDRIEKPTGGTNFWDALHYVLKWMLSPEQSSRRSAVIVMTDGVDNALPEVYGDGSQTTFPQLLETVHNSSAIVFPIYLDTEREQAAGNRYLRNAYAMARDKLTELAVACGTVVYRANKLADLDKVYQQVISDVATVYSIGYSPSNPHRDGRWRSVTVRVPDYPDVMVHTKPGYYARVNRDP